jgi:drug/metabolite transporter (DMT)-like permease
MSPAAATTAFGLGAAAVWGAADFLGGIAARRLRVFWLLTISHGCSLIALLGLAAVLHLQQPSRHILFFGLLSGYAGGTALLVFYHALSLGGMGITAAVTGLVTAALPVVFTALTLGAPSSRQQVGFCLAAVAIWLISAGSDAPADAAVPSHSRGGLRRLLQNRLLMAVLCGIGFGLFLIFLRLANGANLVWTLAASRVGSLSMALGGGLLFSRRHLTPQPQDSALARNWKRAAQTGGLLAIATGACDTSGNFLFLAATRTGRLDVAAMLSSLYPAATILLAAWLLHERTTRRQTFGMVLALAAVVMIS